MKYFIVSLLIHISVLVSLSFFNGLDLSNEKENQPMQVSLLEIIKPVAPTTPVASPKKRVKRPTLQALAKVAPAQKEVSQLNEVSAEILQQVKLSYTQELKFFLEKNKTYPRPARKLRHSGVVKLRVKISPDGKFYDVSIVSPAPFNTLNSAAVKLFEKLGRFKPLPKEYKGSSEFIIPIAYKLRGRRS